jgi:hypothetical protein
MEGPVGVLPPGRAPEPDRAGEGWRQPCSEVRRSGAGELLEAELVCPRRRPAGSARVPRARKLWRRGPAREMDEGEAAGLVAAGELRGWVGLGGRRGGPGMVRTTWREGETSPRDAQQIALSTG